MYVSKGHFNRSPERDDIVLDQYFGSIHQAYTIKTKTLWIAAGNYTH